MQGGRCSGGRAGASCTHSIGAALLDPACLPPVVPRRSRLIPCRPALLPLQSHPTPPRRQDDALEEGSYCRGGLTPDTAAQPGVCRGVVLPYMQEFAALTPRTVPGGDPLHKRFNAFMFQLLAGTGAWHGVLWLRAGALELWEAAFRSAIRTAPRPASPPRAEELKDALFASLDSGKRSQHAQCLWCWRHPRQQRAVIPASRPASAPCCAADPSWCCAFEQGLAAGGLDGMVMAVALAHGLPTNYLRAARNCIADAVVAARVAECMLADPYATTLAATGEA